MSDTQTSKQKLLSDALEHLHSAIELLDVAGAPGQIAAHVDLAANQLEELIPVGVPAGFMPVNENEEGGGKVAPF